MSTFSLTSAVNLFKIKYFKVSENVYNSANVIQGRIKKNYNFTGKNAYIATPMSFSGGVGSGSLPTAGVADYKDATFSAKSVYATCEVQREAIKASANDEGAFVRATKETVQKCVESYMRNASRIFFGDGSGILGRGDGTGANVSGLGTTASPYVVVIPLSLWNEANFEEKDLVQIVTAISDSPLTNYGGAAETTKLEIVEVVPSSRTVKLVGTSVRLAALTGSGPLAATDGISLQGSYQNDPMGLGGVEAFSSAATGSLYNIAYQRRWSMYVKNAAGAGLLTDDMNEVSLEVEKRCGKAINMIVTSYTQYRKFLNQLEDQKRYCLPAREASLKGIVSFSGVEFMTSSGPVGVFPDRFCAADRMYFLNDNQIEAHHRPGFGWFDDDGTIFLRTSGDSYEARYGGYYENYIVPSFHGCIKGLAL